MKTPKMGRPKLPKGEAKSFMVRTRVTPDEFRAVANAAKETGEGLSEWARKVLLSAATKPAHA
jgi:predicted HicB family RNase H-like nuclease